MKNKTTWLLLTTVAVLCLVAYYVLNQDEAKRNPMSDFAIKDISTISKIVITESNKFKATLEKTDNEWIVNNKFKAREENINLILETIRDIAVQSSVSNSMKQTVVSSLATRYKKVEIFENGKLSKTYYIGSPTKDHYGTFMLLEKDGVRSSEPFIMHKPGHNGFLESRFFTEESKWKYSGVFVYDPLDIREIRVAHADSDMDSYIIKQKDKKITLLNWDESEITKYDKGLVENYILIYEQIYFNKIAELSSHEVDSIQQLPPLYSCTVTNTKGEKKQVNFVLKPNENGYIDDVTGEEKKWDENMIYGYIPDGKEVYYFQYFNLGNIFAKKAYFSEA